MGTAIKHLGYKASWLIFDIWSLMLRADCQSAQMSKITNDCLTWSAAGCFIPVPYCNSGCQDCQWG